MLSSPQGKNKNFSGADPPEDDDPWNSAAHIDWEGDDDGYPIQHNKQVATSGWQRRSSSCALCWTLLIRPDRLQPERQSSAQDGRSDLHQNWEDYWRYHHCHPAGQDKNHFNTRERGQLPRAVLCVRGPEEREAAGGVRPGQAVGDARPALQALQVCRRSGGRLQGPLPLLPRPLLHGGGNLSGSSNLSRHLALGGRHLHNERTGSYSQQSLPRHVSRQEPERGPRAAVLRDLQGCGVEEVVAKRDAWVQFLYLRVFDWIVSSINRQLSFSRLVL
ncbi:hypothetical protein CEXT_289391 [Caerostris extrusa]|uniref:Uncharacterized protein n=1 Tax=Caerostris extrusa TaxID=172846 RepID=A0AAV4RPY8_CAEEX|nr:hypothetical protein CEXT_289391 [Caerostris extrusa]